MAAFRLGKKCMTPNAQQVRRVGLQVIANIPGVIIGSPRRQPGGAYMLPLLWADPHRDDRIYGTIWVLSTGNIIKHFKCSA